MPGPIPPSSASPSDCATAGPAISLSGHAESWSRDAFAAALADLRDGLAAWRIWTLLGWSELRARYRRSLLGPFWITLSMAIFILLVGVVFARLFGATREDYLPFIATGYLVWLLLSAFITDGCNVFVAARHYLRQMRLPKSTFVLAAVWRNIMVFAHNLPIVVAVLAVFGVTPTAWTLMALPGLLALAVAGIVLALVLGMVAARFRDLTPIAVSLVQLLFFLTPVLYSPAHLGGIGRFVAFNPATHFIAILRAPLLGQPPPLESWLAVLGMLAVGGFVGFLLFVRFRARITYWV
jgi:lipopolysaccharide transport system permease protein